MMDSRPSLFDLSHLTDESLSDESTSARTVSLFNLETSSSIDYTHRSIEKLIHPFEFQIPPSASTNLLQDEGYVTPDFEAGPSNASPVTLTAPAFKGPVPNKSRAWVSLLGSLGAVEERPLLNNHWDAESVNKMMWLVNCDLEKWVRFDPVVLNFQEFIHDIKFLLVGVPSRSFHLDSITNTFSVAGNIKLAETPDNFALCFAKDFIACGNQAVRLNNVISNTTKVRYGPVYITLCNSVSVYLHALRSSVLSLNLDEALISMVGHLTAPIRSQLQTIAHVCRGLDAPSPPTGAHLINRLFTELQFTTTANEATLIYSLLHPCLNVYLDRLFRWIFRGELDDPYQEFFVDKKLPHIISNSRNFWTSGFVCRNDLIPSFLQDLGDEILACGKTMYLLRTCDPDNPLFRLIDASGVSMDVCDSYELLKRQHEAMNSYRQQCVETLGTCERFVFTGNSEKEKLLQDAARQAQEVNMASYEAKRRKEFDEMRVKKNKQLLELKQLIDDLKLRKEEEERLKMEAEKKWLEQIKKEHELDVILEQTKQAKIGEFYKSLLEQSQKRTALTIWKLKRTKLAVQRMNFLCNETLTSSETPDQNQPPSAEEPPNDFSGNEKPVDEVVRSLINELDPHENQLINTTVNQNSGGSGDSVDKQVDSFNDYLVLLQRERETSNDQKSIEASPSLSNPNFKAWLDNKDEALRNRVKVLSSDLGDILTDFKPDISDVTNKKNAVKSEFNEIVEGSSDGSVKLPDNSSDKKIPPDCDIDKCQVVDSDISDLNKSDSPQVNTSKSVIFNESHNSEIVFNELKNSKSYDKLPNLQNDITEPPKSPSCVQKSPSTKSDDISELCSPKSGTNKSSSTETATYKPCSPDSTCTEDPASLQTCELENVRYLNLTEIPRVVDPFQRVLSSPQHESSRECEKSPLLWDLYPLTIESVRLHLQAHTQVANYSLMKTFVRMGLVAHLQLFKNHFLLHNVGFRSALVQGLGSRLQEFKGLNAGQVDWSHIGADAFLQVKSGEVDPAQFLSFDIENLPSVLDITDPEVFDCFSLQYSSKWPLNIIFTPEAITHYNTIFKFLLKVAYVDSTLMNQFKLLSDKTLKKGTHYKKICLFRHSMTHFIHPLACFISESIIQAEFDRLLVQLEKDCHIDVVYYKHIDFIKSLISNCFLTTKGEDVAKAFKMLFRNALQFNEALAQGSWSCDLATGDFIHSNFAYLERCFCKFRVLSVETYDYLLKLSDRGYNIKLQDLTVHLSLGVRMEET